MSTPTARPSVPAADEILGLYFPVLDHGFVALVDYMGSDEEIERAARVSYGAGTRSTSATRTLLRHLRRHKHTTPSEMVEVKIHCCMPIFIARQWIRHRTASVNEMSGRYSLLPMLFYTPPEEQFRKQSVSNKQGRGDQAQHDLYVEAVEEWGGGRLYAQATYEFLTGNEVARELARIDLPLSTYTQWYWKIDLHNLLHFLTLRVDSHAQWEIQEYGKVIAGMVKRVAPLSYEAWVDYDVCGIRLSRAERDLLARLIRVPPPDEAAHLRVESRGNGMGGTAYAHPEDFDILGREAQELVAKLSIGDDGVPVPIFELDLSRAQPGSYFQERMAAAAPKADIPK